MACPQPVALPVAGIPEPAIGDAQSPVSENTGTVHRSLWRYSRVDAGDSDERKTRVQSMATSAARAMASGDVALIVSAVV